MTAPPLALGADDLAVTVEGLVYALDRPPSRRGGKVVVKVRLDGADPGPPFVDRVDALAHRDRARVAGLIAAVFGRQRGEVLGHLALLLDQVERAAAASRTREPAPADLSPERRAAAEALLAQPDVLDRAARAMRGLGLVGEQQNVKLLLLVGVSRLLDAPLSALLLSPSGSGKSHLLAQVMRLLPEEALVPVTRLTAQSLFYMGEDALRHRVVVVEEYEGSNDADHPLRVLQSAGELRLTVTAKGKAEQFVVRGPVALLSGTTSSDLDVQNTSRCLLLTLDTSPEQTARIQREQARAWAGKRKEAPDLGVWRDAQRILSPAWVVVPFATRLRFPTRSTADRRTSAKVLALVATHALLHQVTRPRDRQGRVVAQLDDYRAAYELLAPSVAGEIEGLSPRAAALYRAMAAAPAAPLTKREAAGKLGWSYPTAHRATVELLAQELVRVEDPGQTPERFRLVPQPGPLGDGAALTPPDDLAPA